MTARKNGHPEQPEQTFEAALERLETIVADMEDGALSLDEMIKRFEEGQALIGLCTRKLDAIDHKVERLVKQGDKLTTEPLDDGPPEAPVATDDAVDDAVDADPPAQTRADARELF